MAEVSNKTLATLLVAAIVISLGGTLISLNKLGTLSTFTGMAAGDTNDTQASYAQLNITGAAAITASNPIDFGTAFRQDTAQNIDSDSDNSLLQPGLLNNCSGNTFDVGHPCVGIIINNTGSVDVSVNVTAGETAASWIGGTCGAQTSFWTTDGDYAGGSAGCTGVTAGATLTNTTAGACANLGWEPGADVFTFEMNATFCKDSYVDNAVDQNSLTFFALELDN